MRFFIVALACLLAFATSSCDSLAPSTKGIYYTPTELFKGDAARLAAHLGPNNVAYKFRYNLDKPHWVHFGYQVWEKGVMVDDTSRGGSSSSGITNESGMISVIADLDRATRKIKLSLSYVGGRGSLFSPREVDFPEGLKSMMWFSDAPLPILPTEKKINAEESFSIGAVLGYAGNSSVVSSNSGNQLLANVKRVDWAYVVTVKLVPEEKSDSKSKAK